MKNLLVCALVAVVAVGAGAQVAPDYSFHDLSLPDSVRVERVLGQLTLEEKLSLLSTDLGVERLGIGHCGLVEGLHGLELGGPGSQRPEYHRSTTIFPQAYGLGESWDTTLVRRVAEQAATEARYYTQHPASVRRSLVQLAPNADLARDPRWGRTEESFGEDPRLTAAMTVATVRGLQGNDARYWRVASLMKHFLANSNEFGRDSSDSRFDERLFRDYYAYPFYKGVTEGGSRAFMAAYNSWNGIPMAMHPCLDSIARREWGQNGIICTDGGALGLLIDAHKQFPTRAEGAAAIVKAGTGMFLDRYRDDVEEALERGLLTEDDITRAVRGNIFVALKLGLLDAPDAPNPYKEIGRDTLAPAPHATDHARALAREAVARTAVLLKNDGAMLPLRLDSVRKVALIGPYADNIVQDWYCGRAPYGVTLRKALAEELAPLGVELLYATDNRMDSAVMAAREADVVIVCTGNHPYGTRPDWKFCPVPSDGREAADRRALTLPDADMVRQIVRANPRTVLVLVSSFPYALGAVAEEVPAILHTTHCAQEQGHGLMDVLTGRVNPAGHTTQTWPADILDLPPMMDYDICHGHTYMYSTAAPLYPFGYGLSYTTFEYSGLKLSTDGDTLRATFALTNTGSRDGEEVAQLYLRTAAGAPLKLRTFARVAVPAGESRRVELSLPLADAGDWRPAERDFRLPAGARVEVAVGGCSTQLPLRGEIRIKK
ncbi:MAG: glycoside hydrolase family 3 C-terminal domain-containing protein [Muribaculaceae bacterium]|nr:glycoside hydrolase family 3 C-terminal domain-containing protein [Muribaculaceae bacterium]